MSLFQAREWWSVRNGSEEEFDKGCICIGNVDADPSESGKGLPPYSSLSDDLTRENHYGQLCRNA